jgi:hypothetical protein
LELTSLRFDGLVHLTEVLKRALMAGGQVFNDAVPFAEGGGRLRGRPARVSVVGPPVSTLLSATIRLHPSQPLLLGDLLAQGNFLPPQGATLLRAILKAGQGILIAGEAGTGKTTLAGALAHELVTDGAQVAWVERTAELPLPARVQRFAPTPATAGRPPLDFADSVRLALAVAPDWLVVDEAHADDSVALWEALSSEKAPRYLWTMRAPARTDRLRSALTMLLHRAAPATEPEILYAAFVAHVPYVAILGRAEGALRLVTVGEWQVTADGLQLRALLEWRGDSWTLLPPGTDRPLPLPSGFWA